MSKLFNIRIDPETESKINKLKSVYGIKSAAGLIKFLIDCHYRFWMEVNTDGENK